MIEVKDLSLQLGRRSIFKNVNLTFEQGNRYGIIGGNGGGKTTLLRLIAGEIEPTEGTITIPAGEKISALDRNHYAFSEKMVIDTASHDLHDEKSIEEAKNILSGLGVRDAKHQKLMVELSPNKKLRTMLARALFGNPSILLLDDPTQYLDINAARWFENFMTQYKGTAIIVSHDRHFLNRVCTYICDVEIGSIELFKGNFNSWRADRNLPNDSWQVESPEQIQADTILSVDRISKSIDNSTILSNVSFTIKPGEKVAFVGNSDQRLETLFQILAEKEKIDRGFLIWNSSAKIAYLPKNYSHLFDGSNLSNAERAVEMLKKIAASHANVLILHEPTAHLDLESIMSLNESLIKFDGTILFTSTDREFVQSIATRIIDLAPEGTVDRISTYADFLSNEAVRLQLKHKYQK